MAEMIDGGGHAIPWGRATIVTEFNGRKIRIGKDRSTPPSNGPPLCRFCGENASRNDGREPRGIPNVPEPILENFTVCIPTSDKCCSRCNLAISMQSKSAASNDRKRPASTLTTPGSADTIPGDSLSRMDVTPEPPIGGLLEVSGSSPLCLHAQGNQGVGESTRGGDRVVTRQSSDVVMSLPHVQKDQVSHLPTLTSAV